MLKLGGQFYFLYAGYDHFPDYGSANYIMRMSNPYTLTGDHVLLTAPTFSWEKQGGMAINEGPVTLHRNGRIFLIFLASTTWSEEYALDMLTMNEEDDPMLASSWTKSPQPVFPKSAEKDVYAPEHNSFMRSKFHRESKTEDSRIVDRCVYNYNYFVIKSKVDKYFGENECFSLGEDSNKNSDSKLDFHSIKTAF